MELSKQNILLLSRSTQHGGTENVIIQLCEILKPFVNKVIVCTADGFDVRALQRIGIKHYTIPDIQNKSIKNIMIIVQSLKRIVDKEQITVIHSHHRMAAFYAELLFGKNMIKIANAHNTFFDKRGWTRFAYKHTYVIAVGEKVKENLVNVYKLSNDQVTVIHNAIKPFDEQIIRVKELQEAGAQGYIRIGNIGRLTKQKGMRYFVEAASKVYKKCPNSRFYIVGDGEERLLLEQMTKDQMPEGVLNFLGYRSDIRNVMSQMDFVVLSSLWEGFPLTPIEAFSVGKPVVATAVDGTVEIVRDHENGLLVSAEDTDSLATAMNEMIENQGERERLGKAAYESFEKEFSFEKMSERYISYYRDIIK